MKISELTLPHLNIKRGEELKKAALVKIDIWGRYRRPKTVQVTMSFIPKGVARGNIKPSDR